MSQRRSTNAVPQWPNILTEQVKRQDFVLFVGSGVSTNSKNDYNESPPTWHGLLTQLNAKFLPENSSVFRSIAQSIRRREYLAAAELLAHECEERSLSGDFRESIGALTDGINTADRAYKQNDLHDLIGTLDPRIIITTNYDQILERYFKHGYRVKTYDQLDIASTTRRGHALILKLHGNATDPDKTILTRLDFARLRREGAHALETVQALLLTRTALFVGYSLSDPDLRLILENLFGAQGQEAGHYLLTSNQMQDVDKRVLKEVYGVRTLEYGGDHFNGIKRSLEALVADVQSTA